MLALYIVLFHQSPVFIYHGPRELKLKFKHKDQYFVSRENKHKHQYEGKKVILFHLSLKSGFNLSGGILKIR